MHVLPKIFKYKIFEEVSQLSNGELSKRFVKVYHDHRGDEFRERLKKEAALILDTEEKKPSSENII